MANNIIDYEGVEIIRPGGVVEHFRQALHAWANPCEKTLYNPKPAPWPQKLPKPAPACFGWGKVAKTGKKCTSAWQGGFMPHHFVLAFRCTLCLCMRKLKAPTIILHL